MIALNSSLSPKVESISQTPSLSFQKKTYQILENLKERFLFFIEFIKDPLANGSIVPSSKQLTKKMIEFIPKCPPASTRSYLEVGAGTGIFTKSIVKRLRPCDRLDIVELNSAFCKTLKSQFQSHPNVHIHCVSITDWKPAYQYDTIISGLPLNCFAPKLVRECLDTFKVLIKKEGTLSYFDYPAPPKIWLRILWGRKRRDLQKVLQIKKKFFQTHCFKHELIQQNFPTAHILHFKLS